MCHRNCNHSLMGNENQRGMWIFFQEFLLWEFPSIHLRTPASPSRSKCSQLCNGWSLKRAALSSPGEPSYISVVDTEIRCYKDLHCSTHESPGLFQAWRKGQKPQEEMLGRIQEVLGTVSQTGFLFNFKRQTFLWSTLYSSLSQYLSLQKIKC